MKISLIIPVYNVEKYLHKCFDSIVKQTYKNLEVIIVNDGSTDGSDRIIEEYAEKYDNFRAFKIENRGQGGARNYGLSIATGEYICFLDSDDYISEDCIEKLADAVKKYDCDMVACNNYDVTEDGTILNLYKNKFKNRCTNVEEEPEILFNRVSPWGKLFKKELFEGVEFVTRKWYEDMRLTPKLCIRAKKIAYIDDALFFYVQRQGSTMNNSQAKRNLEIIEAFEDLRTFLKEEGLYGKFEKELKYMVIEHVAVATITRVVMTDAPDKKAVLRKIQEYLDTYEDLYNNPYLHYLDRNKRIILALNRKKLFGITKMLMNCKKKSNKMKEIRN